MARARQEGSSPEPVEGLARDGPRPFPLSRLVPSAVSCGLCEPGLPAAPAAPALLPAAYLCAPTAPPAVTAALGAPRWPGGPRSRPRGPRPDGECLPRTLDAGSWEKRDPEEPGKGERVGGGGEPAGPRGGCGQCGLCVARSRKTEWEAGVSRCKLLDACVCAKSLQSCPTLCDPTDCSPPCSSAHEPLQVRTLQGAAVPSPRGSSPSRDQTCGSYTSRTGRRDARAIRCRVHKQGPAVQCRELCAMPCGKPYWEEY